MICFLLKFVSAFIVCIMNNCSSMIASNNAIIPTMFAMIVVCVFVIVFCLPFEDTTVNGGDTDSSITSDSEYIVDFNNGIIAKEAMTEGFSDLGRYVARKMTPDDVDPVIKHQTIFYGGNNADGKTIVIDGIAVKDSPVKLRLYYNVPLPTTYVDKYNEFKRPKLDANGRPVIGNDGKEVSESYFVPGITKDIVISENDMKKFFAVADKLLEDVQKMFPRIKKLYGPTWVPIYIGDNGIGLGSTPRGADNASALANSFLVVCKPSFALSIANNYGTSNNISFENEKHLLVHEFVHVLASDYYNNLHTFGKVGEGLADGIASIFVVKAEDYLSELDILYASKDLNGLPVSLKNSYSASGIAYTHPRKGAYNGTPWLHVMDRYGKEAFQDFIVRNSLKSAATEQMTFWAALARYFDSEKNLNRFCATWLADLLTLRWCRQPERINVAKAKLGKLADKNLVWSRHIDVSVANFNTEKKTDGITWTSKHMLEACGFVTIGFDELIRKNTELQDKPKLQIRVSSLAPSDQADDPSTWVLVFITSLPGDKVTTRVEYTSNQMIVDVPVPMPKSDATCVLGIMHTKKQLLKETNDKKTEIQYKVTISAPQGSLIMSRQPDIAAMPKTPPIQEIPLVTFGKVFVFGKKDKIPNGIVTFDVTSRSPDAWCRELSTFNIGPVTVEPFPGTKIEARRFENGWQFLKMYPEFQGNNKAYLDWATNGFKKKIAVRFPMGKGRKPVCTLWQGKCFKYIEARFKVFAPLYARCIETNAPSSLERMRQVLRSGKNIALYDFNGYNHIGNGLSLEQVMYNTKRNMGHAFVIAMILMGSRVWENNFDARKIHVTEIKNTN